MKAMKKANIGTAGAPPLRRSLGQAETVHHRTWKVNDEWKELLMVNYAERLQSVPWAVRPPAGAWVEGQLYWRLLARSGLFNARKVLSEIAAEIPYFAPAEHEVPATGVDLKQTVVTT